MNIAAVSIFYNTKQLLKPLYQSYINNSGVVSDFYVYDNSNDVSQQLTDSDIENTCIQLRYIPHEVIHNMIGSKMHAKSIQFAFDDLLSLYDYIILLDSDVIITGSISDIIDQMEMGNYIVMMATIFLNYNGAIKLAPFLIFFNLDTITYFTL